MDTTHLSPEYTDVMVRRYARILRTYFVGAADHVVTLVPEGLNAFLVSRAIHQAAAAEVRLPPDTDQNLLSATIEQYQPTLVIADARLLENLEDNVIAGCDSTFFLTVGGDGYEGYLDALMAHDPAPPVEPDRSKLGQSRDALAALICIEPDYPPRRVTNLL